MRYRIQEIQEIEKQEIHDTSKLGLKFPSAQYFIYYSSKPDNLVVTFIILVLNIFATA